MSDVLQDYLNNLLAGKDVEIAALKSLITEMELQRASLNLSLAVAERRLKACARFAEPYTSATGSRWWELQLQGETFLEAVDAAGRDEG